MPRFAELPSGQRLEFPDGTTDDVIQSTVKRQLGLATEPAAQPVAKPERLPGSSVAGVGEALTTIGTGIAGTIAGGLAGIPAAAAGFIGGLAPGGESPGQKAARFGAGTVEAVRGAITVDPVTEAGVKTLGAIGAGAGAVERAARVPAGGIAALGTIATGGSVQEAVARQERIVSEGVGRELGEITFELTGSPALAATLETAPSAIAALVPLKVPSNIPFTRIPIRKPAPRPEFVKPTEEPDIKPDEPSDFAPKEELTPQQIIDRLKKAKPTQKATTETVLPDPEIVASAQRLGVSLNPEHYANSSAFRAVALELKGRATSPLAQAEKKALDDIAQRGNDLVQELGGDLDPAVISTTIKEEMTATIDQLKSSADVAYKSVRDAIDPRTRVDTGAIKSYIDNVVDDLGGNKDQLSTVENQLLKAVKSGKDGTITYQALDRLRRDIGEGFGQGKGPFANDSQRVLREVYDVLSDTQNGVAEAMGVGPIYSQARQLVSTRKAIEDQAIALFGKNLSDELISKVSLAGTRLTKGDVGKFNQLINSVPPARRAELSVSVMTDLLGKGRRGGGPPGLGFVNIWKGLNRNQAAKNALFKNLPDGARKRFDDIGRVLTGIARSNEKPIANPSGSAGAAISALETGSVAKNLFRHLGANIAQLGIFKVTGGVGGGLVRPSGKVDAAKVKVVDDFLNSSAFSESIGTGLKGDIETANSRVKSSPKYKAWVNALPAVEKSDLARLGFIGYLAQPDETDQQ